MDNISRVKINFKGENIPYGTIPYGKDSLVLLLSVDRKQNNRGMIKKLFPDQLCHT